MVLTAMIALGHWDEFRLHLRGAFNNGLTEDEIKEVILQARHLLRRSGREPRLQGGGRDHRGARRHEVRMSADEGAGRKRQSQGWLATCATIHMWTQIVGKVKLARAPAAEPLVAHRALSDSARPDDVGHPGRQPRVPDRLRFPRPSADRRDERRRARGDAARLAAAARVLRGVFRPARRARDRCRASGPSRSRSSTPSRSTRIEGHSDYPPEIAERLFRILLIADMALAEFRNGFVGKASPVHFFWGSFDLALTRFSGRQAPEHPGGVPQSGRLGDARSLFARGLELRVLAGHGRRLRAAGLLRLCLSGAARLCRGAGPAGAGVLQREPAGVRASL